MALPVTETARWSPLRLGARLRKSGVTTAVMVAALMPQSASTQVALSVSPSTLTLSVAGDSAQIELRGRVTLRLCGLRARV